MFKINVRIKKGYETSNQKSTLSGFLNKVTQRESGSLQKNNNTATKDSYHALSPAYAVSFGDKKNANIIYNAQGVKSSESLASKGSTLVQTATTNNNATATFANGKNPFVAQNGDLAETSLYTMCNNGDDGGSSISYTFLLQKDYVTGDLAMVDENNNPLITGEEAIRAYCSDMLGEVRNDDLNSDFPDEATVQASKDAWDAQHTPPPTNLSDFSIFEDFPNIFSGMFPPTNPTNFSIDDKGLTFIKNHETNGGHPNTTVYIDQNGYKTIGYGHKLTQAEINHDVYAKEIEPEQADAILKRDVQQAVDDVNNEVHVPINQNQFDALVDFRFNVGNGARDDGHGNKVDGFSTSTLLRDINNGKASDQALMKSDFGMWNADKGIAGRRADEAELFNTPVDQPVDQGGGGFSCA